MDCRGAAEDGRIAKRGLDDPLWRRVAPRHRRLFERLLAILRDDGILDRRGDTWRVLRDAPDGEPARTSESPAEELLARCGEALPDVLRGRIDSLPLLFPSDGRTTATALYETDQAALALHAMAHATLRDIVARIPAGRRIRVLEAGAGTGGTTAHLLSALPVNRSEYWFTDVSPYFTERAKESLRSYPALRTHRFDIEQDPAAQGLEAAGFDVVVAANVAHVAKDARSALANLKRLLAPGGILLLIEGGAPSRWLDVVFGLTEGWWNFADFDLRPAYPLLPADRWRRLALDAGFSNTAAIGTGGQNLIVAQIRP